MVDLTGLCVIVFTLLVGKNRAMEPNSGYCIGNQCFTMFQDRSDYSTAQKQCIDLQGHLMTVRSSASHNVLFILLGNFTGRYWIGLNLPTGCPDVAAKLNGFQWVTKDSESSFFNWLPSFDSSCSSRRCVSVSREDDFEWIQEPCEEHREGFLCEHSIKEPCKSLVAATGESVTYRTPLGFQAEGLLSLPPGSTAIRMPTETKYVCFSEQWLQAPWNCEIQEGGCEYKCLVNPQNVPSCYCKPGQIVNPANKVTCEVASPDPCLTLGCMHACYRQGDTFTCGCHSGFKLALDGRSCVDVNDCTDKRLCPGENFKCVDDIGGFKCVCKDGYKLTGGICVDKDECVDAPCEHLCTNTPGSYDCSCYDGYKEDPAEPNRCKRHCGKEECVAECDPNDRSQCYCPDGYLAEERAHETVCIDIDECDHGYCSQGCKNLFGSYVCSCKRGYTLVEKYKCVKNDDTETDGGSEGSGAYTTLPTVPPVTYPNPTRQPSGVTAGGLVGIIVCTVFFVVLVVFLVHYILSGKKKAGSAGALKAPEGETHGLQHDSSDV